MDEKVKSYRGQHPADGDGWCVVKVLTHEKEDWFLYEKPQAHSDCWVTFKLVAKNRADRKANYWITKNMNTGQLAYPRDMAILRQHRPALHEELECFLEDEMLQNAN